MAPTIVIRVNEKTTFLYTGTLVDENGVSLGPIDMSTLTVTLYDQDTGAIINGRNNQNALNANNFVLTANASGNLTWDSLPADSPIINLAKETEVHIALLQWTFATGTKAGRKEIAIRVVNLNLVT